MTTQHPAGRAGMHVILEYCTYGSMCRWQHAQNKMMSVCIETCTFFSLASWTKRFHIQSIVQNSSICGDNVLLKYVT